MHLTMPGSSELNFSLINHSDFLTQIGHSDQFHHGHRCSEIHAGLPNRSRESVTLMPVHFTRREYRCRAGLHRPGRGGSTPPSRRVRVANFDSEAPALTRMEHGANPWRPTNFNAPAAQASERRASNAEVAGGIPAGSASFPPR